jgi:hypothetical protein
VGRAREVWRSALLERGILPFLRDALADSSTASAPHRVAFPRGRIAHLGYGGPGFSSSEDECPCMRTGGVGEFEPPLRFTAAGQPLFVLLDPCGLGLPYGMLVRTVAPPVGRATGRRRVPDEPQLEHRSISTAARSPSPAMSVTSSCRSAPPAWAAAASSTLPHHDRGHTTVGWSADASLFGAPNLFSGAITQFLPKLARSWHNVIAFTKQHTDQPHSSPRKNRGNR